MIKNNGTHQLQSKVTQDCRMVTSPLAEKSRFRYYNWSSVMHTVTHAVNWTRRVYNVLQYGHSVPVWFVKSRAVENGMMWWLPLEPEAKWLQMHYMVWGRKRLCVSVFLKWQIPFCKLCSRWHTVTKCFWHCINQYKLKFKLR